MSRPMERGSLGTDTITIAKIAGYLVFIFLTISLFWFTANVPEAREQSMFYVVMGVFASIIFISDVVLKKVRSGNRSFDLPDTVTYEEESPVFGKFPSWAKKILYVGAIFLAIYVFFNISQQPSFLLVDAPTYAAFTPTQNAFMSGISGVVEDWFFFGIIFPTIFGICMALTRGKWWIAAVIALLVVPFIFTGYHVYRYGSSTVKQESVLMYGFFGVGTVFLTGSLILANAVHFSNNAGIVFFRNRFIDVGGLLFIFVIIAIIIGLLVFVWSRRRKGGKK